MPYSITTKDGITINNIPDHISPDDQSLKDRVAAIRAQSDQTQAISQQPEKQGFNVVDATKQLKGAYEVGGTMLADIPAKVASGVTGVLSGLTSGSLEEAAETQARVKESLTPTLSSEGQGIMAGIGEALSGLGQVKGIDKIVESASSFQDLLKKTGERMGGVIADPITSIAGLNSPQLQQGQAVGGSIAQALPETAADVMGVKAGLAPKKVPSFQSIKKTPAQLMKESIQKGVPNTDYVTKYLNEGGEIKINPKSKKALNILGDNIEGKKIVSVFEAMNPETKAQAKRMVEIVNKSIKDPIYGANNRPSDILGEAVEKRAHQIYKLNKKAGKEIGEIADKLEGKKVNVTSARDTFLSEMRELGVTFSENKKGVLKGNFENSMFVGGGRDQLNTIANYLKSGEIDAKKAHLTKQFIRDNVKFGKGTESAISEKSQNILKKLSSGVDEVLDKTSKEYRKANEKYAATVDLKNEFDKMAGKDIDLFADLSKKSLGDKARKLATNYGTRHLVEQTLENTDKVLKRYQSELPSNFKFNEDIKALNLAVSQIENSLNIRPDAGFVGGIQRGAEAALEKGATRAALDYAAKKTIDKLRNPDADFLEKLEAYKLLVGE